MPISTFDEYVTSRSGVLLRFAYVLCGDRHLAEDLVQEVLITGHRRWPAIEAGNPDAYLKQALVYKHLSWRRRRAATETPTAALPDVAHVGFDEAHASRDEWWALLALLPRAQRAVLVLRYFEDLDDRRIAELVGASASTVRVHAHRGLHALRETLAQRAEEAPAGADLLNQVRRGEVRATRRRRAVTGVVAAGVVALLALLVPVVGGWLRHAAAPTPVTPATSPASDPAVSLVCPATFDRTDIPTQVATGPLVPEQGASGATLCAYLRPLQSTEDAVPLSAAIGYDERVHDLLDHLNALPTVDAPDWPSWICSDARVEEYQVVLHYHDRPVVVGISPSCGLAWSGGTVRRAGDLGVLRGLFGLSSDGQVTTPDLWCRAALPGEELLAWALGNAGAFRTYSYGPPPGQRPLADAFPVLSDETPGAWCGTADGPQTTSWWAVVPGGPPVHAIAVSGPGEGTVRGEVPGAPIVP